MQLKGSDRRKLRALAHGLDPVVQIGQKGVSEQVLNELEKALTSHELIKVRFVEFKSEKKAICAQIESSTGSANVGTVGHVAIFYRPHPEAEKRKIRLSSSDGASED